MKNNKWMAVGMACALACGSLAAQEAEFDLSSQRSEAQNVLPVPGKKLNHEGIIINPTPQQIVLDKNHRVDISAGIFLKDKHINYCTGCSVCSMYQKPCPQKDDAAEIVEKMIEADVIVMATPVYFYAMSAQMKTLIDRCCGPYTEMKNKEFYFIATAAEEDETIMKRVVDNFCGFLDCLENPVIKGTVFGGGVWHVGEIKDKPVLTEAYEMGKKV